MKNQMQGKVVLVTGGTNGIGEAIAEAIAHMGAQVLIVSRSEKKCAATVERIRNITQNKQVHYYVADLSLQSEVRRVSSILRKDLSRLDVLINNAGAWFQKRETTTEGFEMTWALNHLNYFLLTHELMDLLKATAKQVGEARIINQSSVAHLEGTMHWDNLQFEGNWDSEGKGSLGAGWAVYSQSKLANAIHAFSLAQRLEGTGVVANAVHPGTVVTGFAANNAWYIALAAPIRRIWNKATPLDGAQPAIYLATDTLAGQITGQYYGIPQQAETPNPLATNQAVQDRLWQVSMEQVGLATQ